MVQLGEATVKDHIKTIGLYNAKARNIIKLSQMLIDEYSSALPGTERLERLPGVGRKTANVVLNIAFEPTIAVDTHLFRIGNRTGLAKGKHPLPLRKTRKSDPARIYATCPSLAHSPWTLCVQSAQTGLSKLYRSRRVRL